MNLPLFDLPLSNFIMRPSMTVPRPSVVQTALPKDHTELFLISMVGKSKLAVKTNTISVDMYAVFDITGFKEAYNEIKAACPPQ